MRSLFVLVCLVLSFNAFATYNQIGKITDHRTGDELALEIHQDQLQFILRSEGREEVLEEYPVVKIEEKDLNINGGDKRLNLFKLAGRGVVGSLNLVNYTIESYDEWCNEGVAICILFMPAGLVGIMSTFALGSASTLALTVLGAITVPFEATIDALKLENRAQRKFHKLVMGKNITVSHRVFERIVSETKKLSLEQEIDDSERENTKLEDSGRLNILNQATQE